MANERTYPCLPCADIDESLAFYAASGSPTRIADPTQPLRRRRAGGDPDPSVRHGRLQPGGLVWQRNRGGAGSRQSLSGLCCWTTNAYGKLPVAGIPRITRPRKKYGTVRGFSVVDPGGNWVRVYRLGETEQDDALENVAGLMQVVHVASRLGDAKGTRRRPSKRWKPDWNATPRRRRCLSAPRRICTARRWQCGCTRRTSRRPRWRRRRRCP